VLRGFLDFLRHSDAGWDRLEITDLPARSALLRNGSLEHQCRQSNACPVLFIAPGAETLTDVVPAKKRRNLINARNRAHREGNVSIEIAGEARLDEFLDAMLRLHSTRWNESGKPGVLADHGVQEFHRLLAPMLLRSGVLRFYGLRFERKLIATLYALVDQQTTYCYLQGFDPQYREFSPGVQLVGAVIEDAIREGKRAVDFLRGQEPYKYSWGARDEFTYTLQFGRRPAESSPTMTETAA
jgi:CelD/BcsL family acetyltransferase involved in cellulose biosynthesis